MHIISSQEFHEFCKRSDLKYVNVKPDKKPRIYETKDNEIAKIFYPKKKRFSSDRYSPHALQFVSGAERLRAFGYIAPLVTRTQYCPELNTYIVFYKKIPGANVRITAQEGHPQVLQDFIPFIARLHDQGIFFRSIHLGNLLYDEKSQFALIDLVGIRFKNKSLSPLMRYRNLKHIFLYRHDKALWAKMGIDNFMQSYFAATKLSALSKKILSLLVAWM